MPGAIDNANNTVTIFLYYFKKITDFNVANANNITFLRSLMG